tara:strand:- start:1963 stop:2397 length:435 start_codon:yes stop_codon:yes gene_type:complete
MPAEDPFSLERFESAQEGIYDTVCRELKKGKKRSHWMWFIFPQLDGLGRSSTARHYAIKSLEEADAYLAHATLGPRLLECCQLILGIEGTSATDIFGFPDDVKLRSSMTLFAKVDGAPTEFQRVIDKYFGGEFDQRTIELLEAP